MITGAAINNTMPGGNCQRIGRNATTVADKAQIAAAVMLMSVAHRSFQKP